MNTTRLSGLRTLSYLSILIIVSIQGELNASQPLLSEMRSFVPARIGVSAPYCTATHDVGGLSLLMTNGGMIGVDHLESFSPDFESKPYAVHGGFYGLSSWSYCQQIGILCRGIPSRER
jgi:hypothetical protein